ncbi:MAG: sigma-70 family RNA polymerase sigma factor [Planctomycetes bacterium]|nr:sigma-70 family RNA polymerase sigma factor [Planctomycetota bacterium]
METEPSYEPLERLLAHEPFVRALARSLVTDEALAEDAVQDTWLAALQGAPGAVRSPRAWLARVVRNFAFRTSRSGGRRSRREREAARPEALPSTEEIVGREEARRRLVEAVLALEEPYRRTVLLRYFEGLPPREIARRSGVPVATVGTRLRRAHDRLGERLDAEHGGDRRAWCLALAPFAFAAPAAEAASAGSGIPFAEGLLMKTSTKAAIGAMLLGAVGLVALLPTRGDEEMAGRGPAVAAAPAPPLPADAGGAPASETPLRLPARTTASSSPALPGRVEIRGRLLVRGGGPLGEATVGVRTGDESIDFPETVALLGGAEAVGELKSGEEGRAGLEEAVRERGGWIPAFETAALADGTFALSVPADLPEFRFEVKADFAVSDSSERSLPGDPRLREGVTLLLDPAGKVEGSIRTRAGSPARNAKVARFEVGGVFWLAEGADALGRFAIRGLGPGRHSFVAMGEGGGPLARLDVQVRAGETTRVDFDLPAESWIAGRVVDRDGRGVSGASLETQGPAEVVPGLLASWAPGLRFGRGRTGADGRFRIHSLLPGRHSLSIAAEGFLPGFGGPVEVPAGGGAEGIEVVLESGHRVAGRVVDAAGVPSEGLTVMVVPDRGAVNRRGLDGANLRWFRQKARTQGDGSFSVSGLDAVPLIVLVRRGGKPLAERREVEVDTEGLEVVVGRPTGIAGVVLDGGGNPIRSFRIVPLRVTFTSFGGKILRREGSERPGREFASEDGTFEWTGVETGSFDFRAEARGFVPRTLADVDVLPGEVRRALEFLLEPGVTVHGRVVERGIGAAVAGARIDLLPRDTLNPDRIRPRAGAATSAEDGTFEVSGLLPGSTRLSVSHEAFVEATTEEIEGGPGAVVELLLVELSRGGAVEGRAVGADGLPFVGGSAVTIPGQRSGGGFKDATIDEVGRFRIGGLAPGRYRVEASPRWARSTPREEIERRRLSTLVTVEEGKVATVEFAPLPSGGALVRGRVVDRGEGIPGFEARVDPLAFKHDPEESFARYQTLRDRSGADGCFRIEGVPEGEAEVSVSLSGASARIPAGLRARRRIQVPAGGEIVCDFAIPSGEISGKVVSAGQPVAGLFVWASLAEGHQPGVTAWSVYANTNKEGRYSLGGLPEGVITILAGGRTRGEDRETDDLIPASKEARLAEGGRAVVDFDLERGATALVEVRGPTGRPAAGVSVWVGPIAGAREGRRGGQEWLTDRYGLARVKGLHAGLCVATLLRAPAFAANFSEEKEVRPGEEARFRLDLREGTKVGVRVLDAEGVPIGAAEVLLRDDRGFATPATRGASGWKVVTLPGSYVLEVTAGDRGRKALPVRVGEEPVELDIRLGGD